LVKFPTVSLYIYILIILFYFIFISSLILALTQCRGPFFPIRWPSRTAALPLAFYIILFKPNIFFKENNSKIFSETLFFTK
jgi:hypothetical protein